jgi:hypothetical protein
LTISGSVSSLVNSHSVQWDFILLGDGNYHVG